MKIFYRISDAGYKKNKPDYINNENCLKNFTKVFAEYIDDIYITADNVCEDTYKMICKYISEDKITKSYQGHGAGTFNLTLDQALKQPDNEIIYFVENDYLHRDGSPNAILEGLSLGFPYVTLYDHPDKYLDPSFGGNHFCQGGAENTRVYQTNSCHWKITNSTTMTFAGRVADLKKDEGIMRKWTSDIHPNDFQMFLEIRSNSRFLLSPIPSYSTHGEVEWLAPIINWKHIADA